MNATDEEREMDEIAEEYKLDILGDFARHLQAMTTNPSNPMTEGGNLAERIAHDLGQCAKLGVIAQLGIDYATHEDKRLICAAALRASSAQGVGREMREALERLYSAGAAVITGIADHNNLSKEAPARARNIEGPVISIFDEALGFARKALSHHPAEPTRERILKIVESEPEAPGTMPDVLHTYPVQDVIRASIRATKKNIAENIRAAFATVKEEG